MTHKQRVAKQADTARLTTDSDGPPAVSSLTQRPRPENPPTSDSDGTPVAVWRPSAIQSCTNLCTISCNIVQYCTILYNTVQLKNILYSIVHILHGIAQRTIFVPTICCIIVRVNVQYLKISCTKFCIKINNQIVHNL